MSTRPLFRVLSALGFSALASCALTPNVLLEARSSYSASSAGLGGMLAPTELYEAEKVLDQANLEFSQHGDTQKARDYSYIAQRKVELANSRARSALDTLKITEAEKAGVALRERQADERTAALAEARAELKTSRRENAEQARALNRLANLDSVASVRDESRGQIITLTEGELFAPGEYQLLAGALAGLDRVALALIAQAPSKRMVVEGHASELGTSELNLELSANRAIAVREYLIARGLEGTRITSRGLGASQPRSSANNRVEIVIALATVTER